MTNTHRVLGALRGILVISIGAASARAVDWQELGPAPINNVSYTGRISAIVCSPSDANRYFVAGADGGVWRTVDGGATWTPLTDDVPTTAIGSLALDPTNENVIYAGSGESNFANHSRYGLGVFKSIDGGETWSHLGESVFAGRCISTIVVNPLSPQTIYAGVTRAGGFPELVAAKGHPQRLGPEGVFRSDDGGANWTLLDNGIPSLSCTSLAINAANPSVIYAGIGRVFGSPQNGVYKTMDGGATWTKLSGGLPTATLGRISVAVAPSQPGRVYALTTLPCDASGGGASTEGAYRSDDNGMTWAPLAVPLELQATYGWYLSFVSVRPTDANTIFLGGLNLIRSTNAGAAFSDVTPPHVDLHAAAWDAAGRLVVGDDGGVHRSTNLGTGWTSLNSGLGVTQLYSGISSHPTDDLTFYAGLQDNGSNRRSTATRNWTQVFGGDGGWTQLDETNPQRVFVEYQGTGNIFRSTNGGTNFNGVNTGINATDRNCFLPPYLIDPNAPNRMLYGSHRVYISTNGGSGWSAISGDLTGGSGAIRALAIAPSNSSVVYAATTDGRVLVSTNGGTNFTIIATGVPGWPRVTRELFVHPADAMTLYLAVAYFGETQIRRTRDMGQNWETLDANFPDTPVNVLAVDVRLSKPIIFAGADGGVFRSINEGASWHRYARGLPHASVIDLRLEPVRRRLIATTMGRGAWSVPIALLGDMNGDGFVNAFDIDPFILALTDPDAFALQFPNVDVVLAGDLDGDGLLTNFDIDGFVYLLAG